MNEQVRLDFRVNGRDEVKSAAAATRDAAAAAESYALSEGRVEDASEAAAREISRMASEARALKGYLSQAADVAVEGEGKFRRFGRAAKDAGDQTAAMGRAAMNASQSFQDLVQGGFGAILNNLPRLTEDAAKFVAPVGRLAAAFGGPAGLAAAATLAGVALFALGPVFKSVLDLITRGNAVFPRSADGLKAMEAEIKANAKSLEELEENWRGTAAELEKANRLIERNAELERKADAERERRNKVEALAKKEKADGLDEEGGEIARVAIEQAGGAKKVISEVAEQKMRESAVADGASKALERAAAEKEAADKDLAAMGPANQMNATRRAAAGRRAAAAAASYADAQGRLAAARKGAEDRAADLVTAATDGDVGAIEELAGRIPYSEIVQATPGGRANQAELDAADMAETERSPEYRAKKAQAAARKKKNAEVQALVDDSMAWSHALGVDMESKRQKKNADVKALVDDNSDFWAEQDARDAKEEAKDTPGARLRAMRDQAYQTAAGIATAENDGTFNPAQLEAIARDAADHAAGLNPESIRQAVYRSAGLVRMKMQQDLDAQMGRMFQGGDSLLDY